MITLINWLAYKIVLKDEPVKHHFWLRAELAEQYIFKRSLCWIGDLFIGVALILWLISVL